MRNRIHNVIFKDNALYIKGERINFTADGLTITCGGELSSYTYFGALSVGKWKKYTVIHNLELCVRVKGVFALSVWHTDGKRIFNQVIENENFGDICVSIPMYEEGLVYFTISEVVKEAQLEDAYYYTESESVDNVRLALNICTYNREEYLTRNISVLKATFLRDVFDIEIFVIDNASQISTDRFADNRIHVVHNKNLGGAGGFTRGLIEILHHNSSLERVKDTSCNIRSKFTHVLFMDDDVTIEPESIRRTYMLLSYLKDEHSDSFISGAMLREEQPYIQHENGAIWNAGKCKFIGRGVDLRDEANLVLNEVDYDRDYTAWWYCCMPMSVILYDNLPIPIFVHEDDVEYSLRNAKGLITLNGVCVWHPSSPHRRQSINDYYNLRNMLIVNSRYCREYGVAKATKQVVTALVVSLMRHRYRDMKLIRKAIIDYLAGPEYLMSVDQVKLHKSIADTGYRLVDVSEELVDSVEDLSDRGFKSKWSEADSVTERLSLVVQLISLNGWLLPRRRSTEIHYMNEHPVNLYRAGRLVLFDDKDNKGIVTEKEFLRLFELMGYSLELWVRLLVGYKRAVRKYNDKWNEMTSVKSWSKILGENVCE